MTELGLAGRAAGFREASSEPQVQALPLAHLSIEVGHFYRDDLQAGPERLRQRFQQVAAWVEAARGIAAAGLPVQRPRVSTSFLLDDYSATLAPPGEVLPVLLRAAEAAGVEVDYLAREAACVEADGVPLARLVEERIVADPPPGTDGSRPPVTESGWLCNGQRTPALTAAAAAMESVIAWHPPVENAANRHSVFVDVELWDEREGARSWSCAHLAAVWQLLRLGLLRWQGARVAVAQPWREPLPQDWQQVPAVIQLNPRAAPFSAYRTLSILSAGFLGTEHAVRTILSQVAIDPVVQAQVADRAAAEGVALPREPVDRISYVFTG
jgi:hypothetical protein